MQSEFSNAAKRELAFLVDDFGFELTDATGEMVRFRSSRVEVRASYYPEEGQVDVTALLSEVDDPHGRFVWSGMVGRASVARLLQLAAQALRENAAALRGDDMYYSEIGAAHRLEAEGWTAFYAGRGPRPGGKLP